VVLDQIVSGFGPAILSLIAPVPVSVNMAGNVGVIISFVKY